MRVIYFLSIFIIFSCNPPVPKEQRPDYPPTDQIRDLEPIDIYGRLLRRHVNRFGDIHYKGFKSDSALFDIYLESIERTDPYDGRMSRSEKLAFWINAYNAFTVKLIMRDYPVSSIVHIGQDSDGIESFDYIRDASPEVNPQFDWSMATIAGKTYSLNAIKNEVIRQEFDDPRIHFVLVNGTRSAPKLRREPYIGDSLTQQLEDATLNFFQLPDKNRISPTKPRLSPVMRDYASDFISDTTSITDFVNIYSKVKIYSDAVPTYLPYDWRLNGY